MVCVIHCTTAVTENLVCDRYDSCDASPINEEEDKQFV